MHFQNFLLNMWNFYVNGWKWFFFQTTIGLVLPIFASTKITLDGDGGICVESNCSQHSFKPVSVQAMWLVMLSLSSRFWFDDKIIFTVYPARPWQLLWLLLLMDVEWDYVIQHSSIHWFEYNFVDIRLLLQVSISIASQRARSSS